MDYIFKVTVSKELFKSFRGVRDCCIIFGSASQQTTLNLDFRKCNAHSVR